MKRIFGFIQSLLHLSSLELNWTAWSPRDMSVNWNE